MQSLGSYKAVKRKRAKILEALVKTTEKSKPGGPPRMRGGSSDPMDSAGGSSSGGSVNPDGGDMPTTANEGGPQDRWNALASVLAPSLCKLTGQNVRTPEDWFLLVKDRKGRLDEVFRDE
jgi:hypothetical protein